MRKAFVRCVKPRNYVRRQLPSNYIFVHKSQIIEFIPCSPLSFLTRITFDVFLRNKQTIRSIQYIHESSIRMSFSSKSPPCMIHLAFHFVDPFKTARVFYYIILSWRADTYYQIVFKPAGLPACLAITEKASHV